MLLDRDGIAGYIPHRHANHLLDSARRLNADEIECVASLQPDDPYNRALFLQKIDGVSCILDSILVEIMALGMIVAEGPVPADKLVVFAMINNFVYTPLDPVYNDPIITRLRTLNRRQRFFKSEGHVMQSGQRVASAELMATIIQANEPAAPPVLAKAVLPVSKSGVPVDKTRFARHPDLVVCDTILHDTSDRIISSYEFKPTHVLVPGHFPDMPVMMGVLQWQSVADVLYITQQPGVYTCNASLYNQHGYSVSVITGCVIQVYETHSHCLKTARVAFKSRIHPGDTVFTDITIVKKA